MAEETLIVRLYGRKAGALRQNKDGLLSFEYLADWTAAPDAQRLSLSMPLAAKPFKKELVEAYFGGGLPDEAETRARIARSFGVSPHSLFQLLKAIGQEFPGAVSLHPPGEAYVADAELDPPNDYLDEMALAEELRALRRTPLLAGRDKLRLSLAGAQSKTGLYRSSDGRLALPRAFPSTHIIKPELDDRFPDLILIEYFCLRLADRMGLDVPHVEYGIAQDIPYLLIERYDRVRDEHGRVRRLHQEDFCQALGIPSHEKYEKDGGPGLAACFVDVLDELDAPALDRLRLLDAVIFNYLIGNTDAHGKNFSILYTDDGVRLAPFYDMVSTFLYTEDKTLDMETEMAMSVGKEYEARRLREEHWRAFAEACRLVWSAVRKRLDAMSREIQFEAIRLEGEMSAADRTTPVFHRAVELILGNARRIRQWLEFARVPEEELPGRQLVIRFEERLAVGDQHKISLESFDQRYRRFMTRLATEHRRARLAGDAEADANFSKLGRMLTNAFNAWRDRATLTDGDRRLLEENLGDVPRGP